MEETKEGMLETLITLGVLSEEQISSVEVEIAEATTEKELGAIYFKWRNIAEGIQWKQAEDMSTLFRGALF